MLDRKAVQYVAVAEKNQNEDTVPVHTDYLDLRT